MADDAYAQFTSGLESPAIRAEIVIPSDFSDLVQVSRAINVASSGSVRFTTQDGSVATVFIAAGITFPIRVRKIWETGTTATNIVSLS